MTLPKRNATWISSRPSVPRPPRSGPGQPRTPRARTGLVNTPCASAIVDAAASFVPCGLRCSSTPLCAGASLPSWPGDICRLQDACLPTSQLMDMGVVSTFLVVKRNATVNRSAEVFVRTDACRGVAGSHRKAPCAARGPVGLVPSRGAVFRCTCRVRGLQALHVLPSARHHPARLRDRRPRRWEAASWDFDVHFSEGSWRSASLHVLIDCPCVLLGEHSVQILCLFLLGRLSSFEL